jgi:hypothetical protein
VAKATTNKRSKVEQRVTITDEIVYYDEVTLTLNEEEARALAVLLSKVGGNPFISRRQHTDTISKALKTAGFSWEGSDGDIRGSVYFYLKDETP